AAHRLAGEVDARRRTAAGGLLEEIHQRHGVEQPLARHVAVAAIAGGGPGVAVLDEMLAEPMGSDAQHRSVGSGVRHEAVRGEHELAAPVASYSDHVPPAVVLPEVHRRAGQRLERSVANLPLLRGARHRRDAGLPDLRAGSLRGCDSECCGDECEPECPNAHLTLLTDSFRNDFRGAALLSARPPRDALKVVRYEPDLGRGPKPLRSSLLTMPAVSYC